MALTNAPTAKPRAPRLAIGAPSRRSTKISTFTSIKNNATPICTSSIPIPCSTAMGHLPVQPNQRRIEQHLRMRPLDAQTPHRDQRGNPTQSQRQLAAIVIVITHTFGQKAGRALGIGQPFTRFIEQRVGGGIGVLQNPALIRVLHIGLRR
ncbi:hypothetical protein KCV01_g3349, partial [Aureobasidium melanogenum]